jgi:hypothetical protein
MTITYLVGLAALLVSAPKPDETPISVKVLVLNFDPIVRQNGGQRLHEVMKYRDPHELAKGYASDIETSSRGFIKYKIVKWNDIDAFPTKIDGFKYSTESYLDGWKTKKFHDPDGTDYPKVVQDYGVIPLIDSGRVDEVWMFGGPYFGFWESSMAGPGAFFINGGVYEKVPTKRPFVIMGFNYERGVAEMVHDLCHRAESTLARAYGGWEVEKLSTPWAKFAANDAQSGGVAAVGTCHWPPNAEHDYDYSNPRTVQSSAEDWLGYPKLSGATKSVNRETWGGPDYQRSYLNWWFAHLPHVKGNAEDGRPMNWWKLLFDFNRYDESGRRLK